MPTKRRQKGTGSVFKRGDGYWLAQANVTDGSGKRRRVTRSGKTDAEAKRKLAELIKQLDQTGSLPMGQQNVKAWTIYWLERVAGPRVRPRTLSTYRGHIEQYIVPSIGRVRLDKVTPAHVRQVTDYVLGLRRHGCKPSCGKPVEQCPKPKPLSATTAQHAQVTLTNVLGDAFREGLILRNPAAVVRAPGRTPDHRSALTAEQGFALLVAAEKAQDPMLSRWAMALLTGKRQGECLGLEIERVMDDRLDISWQLQAMSFEHGCGGTCGRKRGGNCPDRRHQFKADFEYRPTTDPRLFLTKPKTWQHVIPLVEPFKSALLTTIGERTQGLVWLTDGKPVDPKNDWTAWKAALKRAGLPDVTLHEARHTAATILLELGYDAKVIGQLLGQSSIVTTQKYQHVSLTLATDAANALARALSGHR